MIRAIAENLWSVEQPQKLGPGVWFPNRMTVIRLFDGSLALYSPVRFDDRVALELSSLGPVSHLIAPSNFHHLHLGSARRRYPEARVLGALGLERKSKQSIDELFDIGSAPRLGPAIDAFVVAGMPKVNECLLLHRPSKTLIVCDFAFNIVRPATKMASVITWLGGVGNRFGVSRLYRSMVKDVDAFRACMVRVLDQDFDRIVMCHGEVLERNGRDTLRAALEYRFGGSFA
jgi:hypothetical protein